MSAPEGPMQEISLRRIRSDGDLPRRPERAYALSSLRVSETATDAHGLHHASRHNYQGSNNRASSSRIPYSAPSVPPVSSSWPASGPLNDSHDATASPPRFRPQTPQPTFAAVNHREHPDHIAPPQHNTSVYVRVLTYFGLGRRASHARKSLVSLIWNISWGILQVVVIVIMLILIGTHFMSFTKPGLTEWTACDRPLGIWASLWVVRVILASVLAYWEFLRDRSLHPIRSDSEAGNNSHAPTDINNPNLPDIAPQSPPGNPEASGAGPEANNLPYNAMYSRLTLLSSLMTLSWFLTAHILEYTSINSCRHSSPHLWWLIFGILCIMYLMVLEVVLLAFVVLVVAPILFIFWNIFLICIGRHPMQNPNMIKPEIGKLPKSVVERIPLVVYIPPPPETEKEAAEQLHYSYPPKSPTLPKPAQARFKLLSSFGLKKQAEESHEKKDVIPSAQDPISWEDNWEQSEYPFVALEGNRAACAICLMDFEEPKRKIASGCIESPAQESSPSDSPTNAIDSQSEGQRQAQLKLTDAGDGAQPLRLLSCGHVFHKTCLDPWLIDVSGRCPVCQRPVEPLKPQKKSRRPT